MSNTYIGLTVGPIFDTLALSSTPASLWAGSYLFSTITKTICKLLVSEEYRIPKENIVSPYYDPDEPMLNQKDGVGLFHDRVIFKVDDEHPFDDKQLTDLRLKTLEEVAQSFTAYGDHSACGKMYNYLNEYVMITGCRFKSDNAILGSAARLDSLELAKPFVQREESNKLLALFVNEGSVDSNRLIKELPVVKALEHWQLLKKDGTIRSLPDIASGGVSENNMRKIHSYYAIVRSDGDKMGEILKKLRSDEEIRYYSKTCLKFCSKIAKTVFSYGGITIYSGGDDLLALMPLESPSCNEIPNIFVFLKKANEIFRESFEKLFIELNKNHGEESFDLEGDLPTLSFGVTVYYNKFPLYEALQDSQYLLFGVAKDRSTDKNRRNCTAIRFQKHAGQSEGLLIKNSALDRLIEMKQDIDSDARNNDSQVFLSALYKLEQFEAFYMAAQDDASVKNIFNNFFDSDAHSKNTFLKESLPKMFNHLRISTDIDVLPIYRTEYFNRKITAQENKDPLPVLVLCYLLRIFKLFKERNGEKN